MTTTRTPQPARQRSANQLSPAQKTARSVVTGFSALMILFGAFFLAFNIGHSRQLIAAGLMLLAGLTLAVISQRPSLYAWMDTVAENRRAKRAAKETAAAGQVRTPKPRGRRAEPPVEYRLPTIRPAEQLGLEFRYIILFGRHLAEHAPHMFAAMQDFWKGIDWESDETDDAYREAVDFLWSLARLHPGWDEDVDQRDMLADDVDPANPFPFLCEAESYHPMVSAVAVLMLVRGNRQVTEEDFDTVIGPWTALKLPFRLADTIFKADKDGKYDGADAPARAAAAPRPAEQPAPTGRRGFRVDVDMAAALASELANPAASAPPAPQPAQPPVVEAEPDLPVTDDAIARHAEPDADDVENPTADQMLTAAELVISSQFGSVPMVSRKLRVGFSLAIKIMHRLHVEYGIVGPLPPDKGAREVMVPTEELDETLDFIREQEAERALRRRRP